MPSPAAEPPIPDAIFALLRREVDRMYAQLRELPVAIPSAVPAVRQAVEAALPLDGQQSLEQVVRASTALLREFPLHVTHPRYFGLFNPSVHPSGVVADALVALYNPQVGGWSHGPVANEMERLVLRRLASAMGFDPDATSAHFTSGGSEANHTAVIAALAHRHPAWATDGIRALAGPPVAYVSGESHHSFTKVARATGLGGSGLRVIAVDEHLRMRVDRLREAIAADRSAGRVPLVVVATAGTTGAGAIDPLEEIADVCDREGLWYHVDAAWGGAAALSAGLRHHLRGIERADSVTVDAHKWLSVPMGAGIFFTRHADALRQAFSVETGYVPPSQDGADDLYKTSLQWSRRFMGLKVLFVLAEHGIDGVGRIVERQAAMGETLRAMLRAAGWRIVNDSPFPLVCFTDRDLGGDAARVRAFADRVVARGRVWISAVDLGAAGWALRACITSFRTDEDDLAVLLDELATAR